MSALLKPIIIVLTSVTTAFISPAVGEQLENPPAAAQPGKKNLDAAACQRICERGVNGINLRDEEKADFNTCMNAQLCASVLPPKNYRAEKKNDWYMIYLSPRWWWS